jgi:hypothetical protein
VQTEQDAEEKKEAEALKGFQQALKNSRIFWAPVELDGSELHTHLPRGARREVTCAADSGRVPGSGVTAE